MPKPRAPIEHPKPVYMNWLGHMAEPIIDWFNTPMRRGGLLAALCLLLGAIIGVVGSWILS